MPSHIRKASARRDGWLHEIKHDGFRVIARKDGKRVKLYSRPGNDLTGRFTRIVDAVARLKARTCIIDGEAVACGPDGIALFDLIRYRRHDERVFLRAFDLIEFNGDDLRREALVSRKATLAIALTAAGTGIELNEHLEHDDGGLVFQHACKLWLRGHYLEAQRFALCVWPFAALDEDEEFRRVKRCSGRQKRTGAVEDRRVLER